MSRDRGTEIIMLSVNSEIREEQNYLAKRRRGFPFIAPNACSHNEQQDHSAAKQTNCSICKKERASRVLNSALASCFWLR